MESLIIPIIITIRVIKESWKSLCLLPIKSSLRANSTMRELPTAIITCQIQSPKWNSSAISPKSIWETTSFKLFPAMEPSTSKRKKQMMHRELLFLKTSSFLREIS